MTLRMEDLQGVGDVSADGKPLARVTYTLQVIEDDFGTQQFFGRIDILGAWTLLYNILTTTTTLILQVADGRHIDFLVTAEGEAIGSAYIRGAVRAEGWPTHS